MPKFFADALFLLYTLPLQNSCTNLFSVNTQNDKLFHQATNTDVFPAKEIIYCASSNKYNNRNPWIRTCDANEPCLKWIQHFYWSRNFFFAFQAKTYARPKPVSLWTVADVQKWYKRHCDDYPMYSELFVQVNWWRCWPKRQSFLLKKKKCFLLWFSSTK